MNTNSKLQDLNILFNIKSTHCEYQQQITRFQHFIQHKEYTLSKLQDTHCEYQQQITRFQLVNTNSKLQDLNI